MQEQGIEPSLEVRYDLSKITPQFLFWLALYVLAAWSLSIDPSEITPDTTSRYGWAHPWLQWVVMIGCAPMIVLYGGCLIDRRPQLRIGPDGVFRRGHWGRKEQFLWSEFTSVHIRSFGSLGNDKVLAFTLRDDAREIRRGRMTWNGRLNRAFGLGDVGIGLSTLDQSVDDILAAVKHYMPIKG